MAPQLTGSVGRSPADNRPPDVTVVQAFMTAYLGSIKSPQIGIAAAWQPGVYDDTLGNIIDFFQRKRRLPKVDGRVDRNGRTWREMLQVAKTARLDIPEWIDPPKPTPGFIDLNVLRFQQTMPVTSGSFEIASVVPYSVMPYLFTPVPKTAALIEKGAGGVIFEFLFKIEKNGAIFWVGACIPQATMDFSRVYIFFHPDTISASDDAAYPAFAGRWPTVQRYVPAMGLQMAAIKAMPVIVPFMTHASRSNNGRTNLFADRGADTLDDILTAIQMTLGRADARGAVRQVGVASYSSGVNHLFRFAEVVGGTGLIREQIDFDSAYMVNAHKNAPILPGAVNWMVTQSPPPFGKRTGWLQLSPHAFRNVHSMRGDTHAQIGNMMFQTMMMLSVIV